MPHLIVYNQTSTESKIAQRTGEVKLGQSITFLTDNWRNELSNSKAKYVLLGIPEDIGVRANHGIGGTNTSWNHFVRNFVNLQDNRFLSGENFILLGHMDCEDLSENSNQSGIEELRKLTQTLDNVIYEIIEAIVRNQKIPIIIGGGHNNVYPIIKGCSLAKNNKVNVINSDPHADFRLREGRHSGNGFRYAYEEKYLHKYAVLGLHESYNQKEIIEELDSIEDIHTLFWEDIFLRKNHTWSEAIESCLSHVKDSFFGVELDMDCLENILSSALTPVGISTQQAMEYLYQTGKNKNVCWLHLPEAIYERADGLKNPTVGKLLSYLVQAFVKGNLDIR